MFFPGTPNIFVPGDSVFMLFKCMCNRKQKITFKFLKLEQQFQRKYQYVVITIWVQGISSL